MKIFRFSIAFVLLAAMTGCATSGSNPEDTAVAKVAAAKKESFYEKHDNAINKSFIWGAGGYALQALGMKHAGPAGFFVGMALGAAEDHREAKDAELLKSVEARGGNKSPTALRGQANSAEAVELYRQCEELKANTPSTYAKREIPDCSYILHEASATGARIEVEKLLTKVDLVGSEYGEYRYSSRRARAKARDYNRRHYHRRYR